MGNTAGVPSSRAKRGRFRRDHAQAVRMSVPEVGGGGDEGRTVGLDRGDPDVSTPGAAFDSAGLRGDREVFEVDPVLGELPVPVPSTVARGVSVTSDSGGAGSEHGVHEWFRPSSSTY